MANKIQTQNLSTPPNDQELVSGQPSTRTSDTWRRWFIAVQNKINIINSRLAALAGSSSTASAGTYGSSTEIPVVTVDANGIITNISQASNTAGSPLTTKGDIYTFSTVNDRLPLGTNGYVLTVSTGTSTGLAWAPASTPTLPLTTKGDILGYDTAPNRVPIGSNNSFLGANSSTTLGVQYFTPAQSANIISCFNLTGLSVPISTSFTTVGSQTTASDRSGRLVLIVTSSTNLNGIKIAGIATPYTIDVCLQMVGIPASNDSAWAGLLLSDGTKFRAFYSGTGNTSGTSSGSLKFAVDNWSTQTSFSSTVINEVIEGISGSRFLRITDNGTTRTFFASCNGMDFVQVYSEPTNTYVTPTTFGIAIYSNAANSVTSKTVVHHWLITNSVLGDAS